MKKLISFFALFLGGFLVVPAYSADLPGITEFIDEMVTEHQFKRDELQLMFARAEHRPDIIEAISRPATARPWVAYRANFVNSQRIKNGLIFWRKYQQPLRRAERKYGVPQEIIVALIGVETFYGEHQGNFRTLDALTTLAFDYPRRSKFFRDELENFLLLAREQQFDLLDIRGSYAGAMGIPQFMPSSYRNYAVDFNGNSRVDLLNEPVDAIGSIGNYLKGYGWIRHGRISVRATVEATDAAKFTDTPRTLEDWEKVGVAPEGKVRRDQSARLLDYTVAGGKEFWLGFNNFEVITRYNNSDYYAMSVFQLAEALKSAHKWRRAPLKA